MYVRFAGICAYEDETALGASEPPEPEPEPEEDPLPEVPAQAARATRQNAEALRTKGRRMEGGS